MSTLRRLPWPLLVAGAGLVVAGLHGGPPTATAPAAATAYVPPALIGPPAAHPRVRVAPGRHWAVHTSAHAAAPARRAPRHPAPHPAATSTQAPATHSAVMHTAARRSTTATVSGPTGWSALNAAVARIPTYRPGAARWLVSSKYDFWGTADWYHDVLYVDPSVPADKLYDVAVHEWSHELSVLDYHGDVAAATREMNATFGGHGLTGAERAADCMAILQGAGWTHYTTCSSPAWRAAAAKLVAGKQLP